MRMREWETKHWILAPIIIIIAIGAFALRWSQRARLGLAIVQRLGRMLGCQVRVRSKRSAGSVFSIETPLSANASIDERAPAREVEADRVGEGKSILIVEDDPEVLARLDRFLSDPQNNGRSSRTRRD